MDILPLLAMCFMVRKGYIYTIVTPVRDKKVS